MTSESETNVLADRFMRAIETGDIEAVRAAYAPDARIWHNHDGVAETVDHNVRTLGWVMKHLANRRYEIQSRNFFESGYVQQHVLHGTLKNGQAFAMPACVIVTMKDGKIVRLDEYLDSAQIQPLLDA
ncbi:MAG TPA: nuclear transport factor 2 family protein [Rhizomicrobium sp.]|jgi:ketosteroid isomerase-like protein|nr:nuclear transport factor 2 family protein [Rhizomicrobium sp.]